MTPAQRAAARTAHTEAVHDLKTLHLPLDEPTEEVLAAFMWHTKMLVGHLALALQALDASDPFAGLTGPEAAGADPTRSTPPQGPTP